MDQNVELCQNMGAHSIYTEVPSIISICNYIALQPKVEGQGFLRYVTSANIGGVGLNFGPFLNDTNIPSHMEKLAPSFSPSLKVR